MQDATKVIGGTIGGIAALITIVMAAAFCICCFKRRNKDPEREAIHHGSYGTSDSPTHCQSPSSGSLANSTSFTKRSNHSIRWDRPQNRMTTETVQPSPQGMVNPALDLQHQDSVQSTDATSVRSIRSNADSPVKDGSLWKDVQKFTANFLNDDATSSPLHLNGAEDGEDSAEGLDHKLGRLQFCIGYDFPTTTLTVKIYRGVNLPAKDLSGTSDPYVRVILLPDKKYKFMTKIKKKNLNPKWNEAFAYEGWPHNKLLEKTLYLQVVDYDRFSRDDPIGEVYIPLNEIDLSSFPTMWKNLQPCKDSRGKLGEILLSLCYQPTLGRLTIVAIEARDLKAKDFMGLSDPYVKIWLSFANKRVEKKKTAVHYGTLNPVFNETFIFEMPWEKIRETSLDISVMDYDKIGRNDLIGKFVLGARCGPNETKHWNSMIANPRQPVVQWHTLKD